MGDDTDAPAAPDVVVAAAPVVDGHGAQPVAASPAQDPYEPTLVVAPPVDPMRAVVARLLVAYPARAEEIVKGVTAHGAPVVSRLPVKVPGGWEQKVLSTHQKYRIADGTILVLEV